MEQYINKSALVAEIEKRIKVLQENPYENHKTICHLDSVKQSVNSLKVKEVNLEHLEQEVKDFCYKFDDRKDKWYDMTPHDKNIMVNPTWSNFAMQLAKHFFELGLNASNPLTWEDVKLIWNIGDEIPYMPEEDFFKELLKRFKAQKGE